MRIVLIFVTVLFCESINISSATFDFCQVYDQKCAVLMLGVACPTSQIQNQSCSDHTLKTFNGQCACGQFDSGSDRLTEIIIDSQIKSQIPKLLVHTVSGFVDVCASYSSICSTFLSAISCPSSLQETKQCVANLTTDNFISNASCVCGSMDTASNRIKELIVDTIMTPQSTVSNRSWRFENNAIFYIFLLFLCYDFYIKDNKIQN